MTSFDRVLFPRSKRTRPVPQTTRSNSREVENNAGGFVYEISTFDKLLRVLILGTDGGTYYQTEKELTVQALDTINAAITEDPIQTLNLVYDVSIHNRSYRQDAVITAFAMLTSHKDEYVRLQAFEDFNEIIRIPTHLFKWLNVIKKFRGRGRTVHKALTNWYFNRPSTTVAYQMTKYPNREGWSHRDVMRLIKPSSKTLDRVHAQIVEYAVNGLEGTSGWKTKVLDHFATVAHLKDLTAYDVDEAVAILQDNEGLAIEHVPTQLRTNPVIWVKLIPSMGGTAFLRNVGNMASYGVFKELPIKFFEEKLDTVKEHPFQHLLAFYVYAGGRGLRGSNCWAPDSRIKNMLENSFYDSFGRLNRSDKKLLVGLDVSGSMGSHDLMNVPGLTPRVGAAALCLLQAYTHDTQFMAFTNIPRALNIQAGDKLEKVMKTIDRSDFGSTDCAQPMLWAKHYGLYIDTFIVYTDNETWAGKVKPVVALQDYRNKYNKYAKLIVVGMTSNGFSIADPADGGMLDVVGFDANLPHIIDEFTEGRL